MSLLKGWICLDIDGTITADAHSIPQPVIDYFYKLYTQGWRFVFITGRAFTFASATLSRIPFPYLFSVQNGSDLLQMPEKKNLSRHYLSSSILPTLDAIYDKEEEDYIIYSGYELGDFCYYRPHNFSHQIKEHLDLIKTLVQEPWMELSSFDLLKGKQFPLIKCLGTKEHMKEIYDKLLRIQEINVTYIHDPLSKEGVYLNLITDKRASKGNALSAIRKMCKAAVPFIAAGDDRNDISMLKSADVAIVMQTAPDEVKEYADVIAPSAKEHGIISGLEQALSTLKSK